MDKEKRLKEIGMTIKKARKSHLMTQSELASKLGVSKVAVQVWERGKGAPKGENVKRLSIVLNIDTKKLLID